MLKHKFVEFMPEVIEDGCLYISGNYHTVIHKCACGCGNEVVTPLSPTDWQLWFDGKTVSLTPSIGNWNFECQSHYFIKKNRVKWCGKWSREEINEGRSNDMKLKEKYYIPEKPIITIVNSELKNDEKSISWLERIRLFLNL